MPSLPPGGGSLLYIIGEVSAGPDLPTQSHRRAASPPKRPPPRHPVEADTPVVSAPTAETSTAGGPMPAPSTVDEFVDLVRKSAVLDEPRLSEYVQKLKADATAPKDPSGVAGLFVRDGLIT